jgi:hypothetical protein
MFTTPPMLIQIAIEVTSNDDGVLAMTGLLFSHNLTIIVRWKSINV